jgi:hypothetical protein
MPTNPYAVAYWAKQTQDRRSQHARHAATIQHQNETKEQKSSKGRMMAKARWAKAKANRKKRVMHTPDIAKPNE